MFCGTYGDKWQLVTDGDEQIFFDSDGWQTLGSPTPCKLDWDKPRAPSGFWVRCEGSDGLAWWPVNVAAGNVLPPPEELKNLPLDVLLDILSSARPLHRVLGPYLKRKRRKEKQDVVTAVDPHKRVDTSQFLLQRTRRLSWALTAVRERLERPVATIDFLQWRLRGPVGVTALADALVREAHSEEEKAFAEGLASSYEAFLHTRRRKDESCLDSDDDEPATTIEISDSAKWYFDHLESLIPREGGAKAGHPKVDGTVKRAIDIWRRGEKSVIFCHYIETGRTLRQRISDALSTEIGAIGSTKLGCDISEVGEQLEKLGRRFFDEDSPISKGMR